MVGAKHIVAIDITNEKLNRACTSGATHTIDAKEYDVVETIGDLTDANCVDVVIDAVGRPQPGSRRFTPVTWRELLCWWVLRHRT